MGDANASIPTPQPVASRPMFGDTAAGALSVAWVAPAALDDGLLDVIVFKRLGYLEIIKYLHDVVFSSDIRVPEIEYFQTRYLRVSSEQDVPLELDGELAGNCPVEFQMHEKALRVLAPSASG